MINKRWGQKRGQVQLLAFGHHCVVALVVGYHLVNCLVAAAYEY